MSDDMTVVQLKGGDIKISAPDSFRGLIEVWGVGLLGASCQPSATLAVVVDLASEENQRLPPWRKTDVLGKSIPAIFGANAPCLAASVLQYLRFGRVA